MMSFAILGNEEQEQEGILLAYCLYHSHKHIKTSQQYSRERTTYLWSKKTEKSGNLYILYTRFL